MNPQCYVAILLDGNYTVSVCASNGQVSTWKYNASHEMTRETINDGAWIWEGPTQNGLVLVTDSRNHGGRYETTTQHITMDGVVVFARTSARRKFILFGDDSVTPLRYTFAELLPAIVRHTTNQD